MFDSVVGQKLPKEILKTAIQTGNLSHAYIFHGSEGVGKTTLALEFMKAIVCQSRSACGVCSACKQFYSTSDIRIIDGEKSISVDTVREITAEIYLKPFHFARKIYLLKNADKMTVQAQNALLKVFEEPPSYAMMILLTSNLSALLPTILSRGTQVRFLPLTPAEVKQCLANMKKTIPADDIILGANGSVTRALALMESDQYLTMKTAVLSHLQAFLKQKNAKEMCRVYQDFLTYEEHSSALIELFCSLVYDCIQKDPSLCKNPAQYGQVSLSLAVAHSVYETLGELAKRLCTNAGYNLSVLSALLEIKNHLNQERI